MPKIDSSYFGSIIIDGKKYNKDVVIFWDGEIQEKDGFHVFSKSELQDLLMRDPELIIIGTGNVGNVKIEPAAEIFARVNGVQLISKLTPQAIEDFNKYSRKKKTIAVLHITC
jgi:hypothetical protein